MLDLIAEYDIDQSGYEFDLYLTSLRTGAALSEEETDSELLPLLVLKPGDWLQTRALEVLETLDQGLARGLRACNSVPAWLPAETVPGTTVPMHCKGWTVEVGCRDLYEFRIGINGFREVCADTGGLKFRQSFLESAGFKVPPNFFGLGYGSVSLAVN